MATRLAIVSPRAARAHRRSAREPSAHRRLDVVVALTLDARRIDHRARRSAATSVESTQPTGDRRDEPTADDRS